MATAASQPLDDRNASVPTLPLVAAAIVALALIASYIQSFTALFEKWGADPNYSHGYFVVPIALYILWERRDKLDVSRIGPRWYLFLPLLAVLWTRIPLHQRNLPWVEEMTLPAVAGALALAVGGFHFFFWALPAILFLGFMIPLPPVLNAILSGPLQKVATTGSVFLLQLTGLPAVNEGNVILVGDGKPLEVARACNGLSMLLSFATLITATAILCKRPLLDKAILMLSILPIAIVSNILRISLTAYFFQMPEFVEKISGLLGWKPDDFTHDGAGYLMMPLALVMIFLELKFLDMILVPDELAEIGPATSSKGMKPEKPTMSTRVPSNPNDYIMSTMGMKVKKPVEKNPKKE
jgi:exosortase